MAKFGDTQILGDLEVTGDFSATNIGNFIRSETSVVKIWTGTQAEYDALSTYDNDTLYFITG